ncbi:MAG: hypothetical protein MZU97_10615 [Bacillus subtilis]|nr:hypothetical protein [Bacillus subtilis]
MDWRPVIDYTCAEDEPLHYGLTDYVGDVHPYYYDGKLYLFYLALDGSFSSALAVSDDLVTFRDQPLTVSALNAPGSLYYALGVIKEGNYSSARSMVKAKTWAVPEALISFIGRAASSGMKKRTKNSIRRPATILREPAIPMPSMIRIPTNIISSPPDIGRTRTMFGATRPDTTPISCCTPRSVPAWQSWEKNPVTGRVGYHRPLLQFGDWVNGDGGDPEVSQMMKIGDRWYLFASIAGRGGDHWVGRPSYWVGYADTPILEMDWQSVIAEEHYLDARISVQAQVFEFGGKYYIYGWITQRNTSGGWGGTLNLLREVYQLEDGTLGTRLESEYRRLIDGGKLFEAEGSTTYRRQGRGWNRKRDSQACPASTRTDTRISRRLSHPAHTDGPSSPSTSHYPNSPRPAESMSARRLRTSRWGFAIKTEFGNSISRIAV